VYKIFAKIELTDGIEVWFSSGSMDQKGEAIFRTYKRS
jgi:hypothetical protein